MGRLAGHVEPIAVQLEGAGLHAETTTEHDLKAALLVRGGQAIDYDGTRTPALLRSSFTLWSPTLIGYTGETLTIDASHELTIVRIGPPVSGGGIV